MKRSRFSEAQTCGGKYALLINSDFTAASLRYR